MGGNLKKRGLDRDTVATQRALQQVTSLTSSFRGFGTTLDSINSFDYEVVTSDEGAAGPFTYPVRAASAHAVISSIDDMSQLNSWSVADGEVSVDLGAAVVITFVVF